MKAIVCKKYGSPSSLKLEEIEKPVPEKNQVRVRVHTTAINDYDWSMVRGKPLVYRLMFGLFKPKNTIAGMELAGVIDSVGSEVSSFKAGDAVFGDISAYGFGSFAEYICIDEKALYKKPEKMRFEDATSIPHAALLALQGLRDKGNLKNGQQILINGAGGGVGVFGLQLAKLQSCEVTGVDTGEKLQMMKSIGFDHVIDYKKVDFTKNNQHFDLILDCKTNRSPFSYLRSLKSDGTYVTVGGNLHRLLQILLWRKVISIFSGKELSILALRSNKGLEFIIQLYNEGKIKCVIDGPYSLADIPELIQYFGEGKHQGKIIIKIQ